METHAIVLDYLATGRQTERGFHREPLALAVGEDELKLLELVPRPGVQLSVGSRIALVVEGTVPAPIDHVRRRLGPGELTAMARAELSGALEKLVTSQPARFLRFFNEAQAVSRRFHLLELLPGIGKKTMQAIVEERRHGPFTSFEELDSRTGVHSVRLLVGRIEQEMAGVEDKYRLFVAP